MATDNKDNKLSIGGGDYAEILRQAVAVIGHDKKLLRSVALLYLSDKSVRRISSYPIWTQGKGRKQHALKGQKPLAQGNALGIKQLATRPVRAKALKLVAFF